MSAIFSWRVRAETNGRLVTGLLLEMTGRTSDLIVRLMLLEAYNAVADLDEFDGVPPLTLRLNPSELPATTSA